MIRECEPIDVSSMIIDFPMNVKWLNLDPRTKTRIGHDATIGANLAVIPDDDRPGYYAVGTDCGTFPYPYRPLDDGLPA